MKEMTEDEFMEVAREAWRGGEIEVRNPNGTSWLPDTPFDPGCEYRIKPRKPSIDWSHVAPGYTHLATNNDGRSYVRTRCYCHEDRHFHDYETDLPPLHAEGFASFKKGNCDPRNSVVERPIDV